ncbi:MAG: hypothetical protein PW789_08805 [Edaphobacter sp.]|nr:hypothetical protein [Edaphobacter sp.]MDE1176695.1 hypothetical protein [Edaphobacter sp.]
MLIVRDDEHVHASVECCFRLSLPASARQQMQVPRQVAEGEVWRNYLAG